MLFLCFYMFTLLSIVILFAGQTFSHFPHPTHLSCATFAKHPLCTFIAVNSSTKDIDRYNQMCFDACQDLQDFSKRLKAKIDKST